MAASSVDRIRALVGALEAIPPPRAFEIALTEYPSRDLSILDVTGDGVSKGSALADLAAVSRSNRADVMALGDNLNDRPMLEFAASRSSWQRAARAEEPGLDGDRSERRGWCRTGHRETGVGRG